MTTNTNPKSFLDNALATTQADLAASSMIYTRGAIVVGATMIVAIVFALLGADAVAIATQTFGAIFFLTSMIASHVIAARSERAFDEALVAYRAM